MDSKKEKILRLENDINELRFQISNERCFIKGMEFDIAMSGKTRDDYSLWVKQLNSHQKELREKELELLNIEGGQIYA